MVLVGGFLFVVFAAYLIYTNLIICISKRSHEFNKPIEVYTTSRFKSITPTKLMFYRIFCAFLYLPVTIGAYNVAGIKIFQAFTYFNWTFFCITFCFGSFCSYRSLYSKQKPGVIENIYWIMLEVEFPATLLIFFVTWFILLPGSYRSGRSHELLNWRSYFVHGINVFLIGFEFYINKLNIRYQHFKFLVLWGTFYGFFHTFLMLVYVLTNQQHCPVYPFLSMTHGFFVIAFAIICIALFGFYNIAFYAVNKMKM